MDVIFAKRREAFFNNLILLGLDKVTFEKKYNVPFHKDMFVLPNKKGYEVVTYFLFSKLSAATGKDYNIPWPLISKEYDRMFQKNCYAHLVNFSQENVVKFPRIVPSLLATFGSDRFYEVYLAFSSYVLKKTIQKNKNINVNSRPVVTKENFVASKHILQLSTILSVQKFRDAERCTHVSHSVWSNFSKILEDCLQKLKQSLKSDEELLKKNQNDVVSLYSLNPTEKLNWTTVFERSFQYWKPVLKQRKCLTSFFAAEKIFWSILESEIGENVEVQCLSGQDYNICVSENLPEDCRKKLKMVGFTSSEIDGKLSVHRFMKLFFAYLMFITDLLKKNDLTNLHEICSAEDVSSMKTDLTCINKLNEKLSEEVIPKLEENIAELKLRNCFDDPECKVELPCIQFCAPLPVVNFSPEAVKERTSHFNFDVQKMFIPLETKLSNQESKNSLTLLKQNSSSQSSLMTLNQNTSTIVSSLFNTVSVARTIYEPKSSSSNIADGLTNLIHSRKYNAPSSVLPVSISEISLSDLDDIDFAPSSQFKMRESWLKEETLNSMTLPDVSFVE